jgi:hypothetical protein
MAEPRSHARFPEVPAGAAPRGATPAAWELRLEPTAPAYQHFPRAWMYRAPLPPTKLHSPYPAVRVDGQLSMGDRRLRLDGWPGTVGHNGGAEHAERWVWLHGAGFAGHGDGTFLDAAGRPRAARRPHHPVRRQRRAQPGRRPPPARRPCPHAGDPLRMRARDHRVPLQPYPDGPLAPD